MRIYNLEVEIIRRLMDAVLLSPGHYSLKWDARDDLEVSIPAGVYFVSLKGGNYFKSYVNVIKKSGTLTK